MLRSRISRPSRLAEELAQRAREFRTAVRVELDEEPEGGPLRTLRAAASSVILHDPTDDGFADSLAQTFAYGLLAARLLGRDPRAALASSLDSIPAADRLLHDLLERSARRRRGRVSTLIDAMKTFLERADLSQAFPRRADSGGDDPITAFYEPFLAAYDKTLREERGVYFTPRPAVAYIVESVHELLIADFGLEDGLASAAPGVTVLDPAAGTGVFLLQCVDLIERVMKDRWRRELSAESSDDPRVLERWIRYVPDHLIPRLCGYELLMAPAAAARLALSIKLAETGFSPESGLTIPVLVRNILDDPSPRPFSVVLGNPPYAGISSNRTEAARRLVDAYKTVDGRSLGERKLWLQDDYVKFIRAAQLTVEAAGAGVLGFITNHGYLANPTFRGMRRSLMDTFSSIHALDLHGNSKRRERAPDGSDDKNIFRIRQGAAICLATRGGSGPRGVRRADLFGDRATKHRWLASHTINTTEWTALSPEAPHYLFEPRGPAPSPSRSEGLRLDEIFPVFSAGFITARDHFVVDFDEAALLARVADLADKTIPDAVIRKRYFGARGSPRYPDGDTRSFKLPLVRARLRADPAWRSRARPCLYRPFDERLIYWTDDLVDWPRPEVTRHMSAPGARALALSASRRVEIDRFEHVFCSRLLLGHHSVTAKEVNYVFPLYLAPTHQSALPAPNLSPAFLQALALSFGERPPPEGTPPDGASAEAIFGYLYAILHSPSWRARSLDQLRSDFPRIPLPSRPLFARLSALGKSLCAHHLMEASYPDAALPAFVGDIDAEIERPSFSSGAVWIDKSKTRGFVGVTEDVWRFGVGGYQVASRWLYDRRGRRLGASGIDRYRRILAALGETLKLMSAIDRALDQLSLPGLASG